MIFENEIIKLSHDNDIEYKNTIRVTIQSKVQNTKLECSSNPNYIQYNYLGTDNVTVPIKKTCILYIKVDNNEVFEVPFTVESTNSVDNYILANNIIQFEKEKENNATSFIYNSEIKKIDKDAYLLIRN